MNTPLPKPTAKFLRRLIASPGIEPLESRVAPATLVFAQHNASGANTTVPVAQDAAGNIYVAGVFDGLIDLDSDPDTLSLLQTAEPGGKGSDLYIAKYNPDGNLLWARSWGGVPGGGNPNVQENARDIVVDLSGNVYVLAEFNTVNAGLGGSGTISSFGGTDVVVLKFGGTDGVLDNTFGDQGALQFGGTGNEHAGRFGLDPDALFFTGSYDSTAPRLNASAPFPTPTPSNGDEVFVFSVSPNDGGLSSNFATGGFLHFGSPSTDTAGQALDSDGRLYIEAYEGKSGYVRAFSSEFGTPNPGFGTNGRLDIANLGAVALAGNGLLATGGNTTFGGFLKRFDLNTGAPDTSFDGDGNVDLGGSAQFGTSIVVDAFDRIYVGGPTKINAGTVSKYFLARVLDNGAFDQNFGTGGKLAFASTGGDTHRDLRLSIDGAGYVAVRGFFTGTTDLDPTAGVLNATAAPANPLAAHTDLDAFLIRLDPNGVDSSNPYIFTDASGDVVKIAVGGVGALRVTPGTTPGVDIEKIETLNTNPLTKLNISLIRGSTGTLTIGSIITPGENQDLGQIVLGKNVFLGDGVPGGDPALKVTGKITRVALTDVLPYSVLDFGEGLSYLDTYTNQPNISIRTILGEGVTIDVTGDGTPAGVGGGGLGRVVVGNWIGAGLIKTTQSVKSFWQKTGNSNVVFEIDKDSVGAGTTANIGYMLVPNGSWGSTGSEIEGTCGTFNCGSFLAGATISAGSISSMTVRSGPFAGTVTLTNPSAAGMRTFRVNSDFTGTVVSESSIRNLQVIGDFMGSLTAASIGSIQAYAFDGTTTGDLFGDPLRKQIVATSGSLGTIKSTGGGMANYEVAALTVFAGFKISTGSGTTVDVTGLDNVKVLAATITSIAVALKPHTGAGPLTLVGIKDSVFESAGGIGSIASSHAIADSLFAAATSIGNITVGNNAFPTQGVSGSKFLASTDLGGDGAIDGDETFVRAGKVGNITVGGAFLTSTVAAGVNPVDGIYGNGDDTAAAGPTLAASIKTIGKIVVGAGSGVLTENPALIHDYVIEGHGFTSLKIGGANTPLTGLPKYLQAGGAEAASDVVLRRI